MKKKLIIFFALGAFVLLFVGSLTLDASASSACTGPKELVNGSPKCMCKNTCPCSDTQGCKSKKSETIKILNFIAE